MRSLLKDDILTALALIILLFSAMVTWTIQLVDNPCCDHYYRHCMVFQEIEKSAFRNH